MTFPRVRCFDNSKIRFFSQPSSLSYYASIAADCHKCVRLKRSCSEIIARAATPMWDSDEADAISNPDEYIRARLAKKNFAMPITEYVRYRDAYKDPKAPHIACCITGSTKRVQKVLLLDHKYYNKAMLEELRENNLLPPRSLPEEQVIHYAENAIPLRSELARSLRQRLWALLPSAEMFVNITLQEEADIVTRMHALNAGKPDPGRSVFYNEPTYEYSLVWMHSPPRSITIRLADGTRQKWKIGDPWPSIRVASSPPFIISGSGHALFFPYKIEISHLMELWRWKPNLKHTEMVSKRPRPPGLPPALSQFSDFKTAFPNLATEEGWPKVEEAAV